MAITYPLLIGLALAVPDREPKFAAVGPAADAAAGRLVRLTPGLTATLEAPSGETIVENVVSLRRVDVASPAFPTGPHVVTTAGDRIAGTLAGGDGRTLRFRPSGAGPDAGEWRVPLSSAVVLWLTDTPAETPPDASRYEWLAELNNQDVLRFRNGDTARGTVDGLDPDAESPTFPFRPAGGQVRRVASSEVAAVAFNPALARFRKPKGPYVRVVLDDGTRMSLAGVAASDGMLSGATLFGQKVRLPLDRVVAIDVLGGNAPYLSDLKPKKVEQAGFLGPTWSWSADRTVRGAALRVKTPRGITTADKGLGTHPRTTLTYDLGGKYGRFEAVVGIDPGAPVRARAVVRVLVDGKEQPVPGLPSLAAGDAVVVKVDVRGAKELVLVTDFGPAGGVGADVNWADARLVE